MEANAVSPLFTLPCHHLSLDKSACVSVDMSVALRRTAEGKNLVSEATIHVALSYQSASSQSLLDTRLLNLSSS